MISTGNRIYRVVLTKDECGYVADIPTLSHCVSYGVTIDEAMANIQEALEGVLMVMEEEGLPIPDDSRSVEYTISVPMYLSSQLASA